MRTCRSCTFAATLIALLFGAVVASPAAAQAGRQSNPLASVIAAEDYGDARVATAGLNLMRNHAPVLGPDPQPAEVGDVGTCPRNRRGAIRGVGGKCLVGVHPDSCVTIEAEKPGETPPRANRLKLQKGTIAVIHVGGKSQSFSGPHAKIDIDGTAFFVDVDRDSTTVLVADGTVKLFDPSDDQRMQVVRSGEKWRATRQWPPKKLRVGRADRLRFAELGSMRRTVADEAVRELRADGAGGERGLPLLDLVDGLNAVQAHARVLEAKYQQTGSSYGFSPAYALQRTLDRWSPAKDPALAAKKLSKDPVARKWVLTYLMRTDGRQPLDQTLKNIARIKAAAGGERFVQDRARFWTGYEIFRASRRGAVTPDQVDAANRIMEAVIASNRFDLAEKCYALECLIDYDISKSQLHRNLDGAQQMKNLAAAAAPRNSPHALYRLAEASVRLGNLREALDHWEAFIRHKEVFDQSTGECYTDALWTANLAIDLAEALVKAGDQASARRLLIEFEGPLKHADAKYLDAAKKLLMQSGP